VHKKQLEDWWKYLHWNWYILEVYYDLVKRRFITTFPRVQHWTKSYVTYYV
jgi:hypothetical protein